MKISFVIPTLNSGATLEECLTAIVAQSVPRENYEIVIADAGSCDDTLAIARKFSVDVICSNELKTGEAGKTAGIQHASGDIIALVDSDNILPHDHWLEEMLEPFKDNEVIASEPIEYTRRATDPTMTRYFALLGMNDPICLWTHNYDRLCAITGRWTGLGTKTQDMGSWLKVYLTEDTLPTIGANGFVFRRELLELPGVSWAPYLFDIDIMHQAVQQGRGIIAKVKTGIVHLYCKRMSDFTRKQKRRIRDFLYFAQTKQRTYPWKRQSKMGIVMFALCTVTLLPLIVQMVMGWVRRRDAVAWCYHIPVCWATLWVYGLGTMGKLLGREQKMVDRSQWQVRREK